MPADGAGEDAPFDLATEPDEVGDGVAVGNVGDVLVDDLPRVQLVGYVVSGRPDHLHTALVRPSIRVCPDERREERMVDVNYLLRVRRNELGT